MIDSLRPRCIFCCERSKDHPVAKYRTVDGIPFYAHESCRASRDQSGPIGDVGESFVWYEKPQDT